MFDNYEDENLMLRKIRLKDVHPYMAISLPRECSLLYSDLGFSTPINAFIKDNPEADKAVDDIIENNNFDMQLTEASLTVSYKGDLIFKNYLENGVSKITYLQPDYYFPKFAETDQRKVVSETIAYLYDNGKKIFTETYESKNGEYWCVTQHFYFNNGKIGKPISEPELFNTKLNVSPLTHIPFLRNGSSFWGESLYKPLVPLFDEYNHRCTVIANILDKHSDPNLIADPSFFDENNNLPMGGKAFPVEEGEQKPEYVVWNWSGQWQFKFIEEIIFKTLHYISPLAPSLYGMDDASQASGRAIYLKSWRSQSTVRRSHSYWRSAIKKILYVAQQIEVLHCGKSYTPAIPNVELTIALPYDQLEAAQAEQLKVTSKLTSIKSAIARLNPHYTSKQIEEEYLNMITEINEINNLTFMNTGGIDES